MAAVHIDGLWESLASEGPVAARIEALRDLEKAQGPRGVAEFVARLEGISSGWTGPLAEAAGRVLARARRRQHRGAGAEEKLDLARQILSEADARGRLQFVTASLEGEAFETAPALAAQLLLEAAPEVQAALAKALGPLGDKAALPALKHASRATETAVRLAAVEALAYHRGREPMRLLLERLTDREATVRALALRCLLSLPRDEVVGILESIPSGKGAKLQRASIGYLREQDESPRARDLLRAWSAGESSLVVAEALLALAHLGDDTALARIMELDGRCEAPMQKVLEMAKAAYGKAVEEESRSVGQALSSRSDSMGPELDDALIGGTAAPSRPEGFEGLEEEVWRPPGTQAPIELGPAPLAQDETVVATAPEDPLGFQDTILDESGGPATASEPTPEPAPEGGAEDPGNPWDSIAQAPGQAVVDFSAPPVPPDATPATPTPAVRKADSEGAPAPAPALAPAAAAAAAGRTRGFRLFLLFLLLAGLGLTGSFAYRARVAARRVHDLEGQLLADFDTLVRAVESHDDGTGRRLASADLSPLVPDLLPALPRDPWGGSYHYDPVLRRLVSPGPDGTLAPPPAFGDPPGSVDDRLRLLGEPLPPVAASFQSPLGFRLASLVPGTMESREVVFEETEGAPLKPQLAPGGTRIAYLHFDRGSGLFLARRRRLQVGSRTQWDPPVALLPDGWDCSSLRWFPDGEGLVAVATPPGGREGLYGVVPEKAPVLLSSRIYEPSAPSIHPDGRRLLLSARHPDGERHVLMGLLPEGRFVADGIRARWGPRGDLPLFGHAKGSLIYLGEDPRVPGRNALLEWHDVQEPSGEYQGEASGAVIHSSPDPLTCPVLAPGGDYLAFCVGERLLLLDLESRAAVVIFRAPRPIVGLTWPFAY